MQKIDKENEGQSKMVGVILTKEQVEWLDKQPEKRSTKVRQLIEKAMKEVS